MTLTSAWKSSLRTGPRLEKTGKKRISGTWKFWQFVDSANDQTSFLSSHWLTAKYHWFSLLYLRLQNVLEDWQDERLNTYALSLITQMTSTEQACNGSFPLQTRSSWDYIYCITVLFRPSVHVMRHKPLWTEHLGNCHRSQLAVNTRFNFIKKISSGGPLKIVWTLTLLNIFFSCHRS